VAPPKGNVAPGLRFAPIGSVIGQLAKWLRAGSPSQDEGSGH
jgi:hypothetical protein